MAKQTKFEGQLPLIAQVEDQGQPEANVIPLPFQSESEGQYLAQALMDIVPEDKRSAEVESAVKRIYSAHVSVINSTREFAKAVYEFCTLTGCTYAEVDKAFHKGTQKQLSKGYISKLYHAGHALNMNPVANKILDIGKLSELGRLSDELIKSALVEKDGQAVINGKFATLLDRNKFIDELRAVSPETFKAKESTWSAKSFKSQVEAAIKANEVDTELTDALNSVLAMLDVRIQAQDEAKKAKSAAKKSAEQNVA